MSILLQKFILKVVSKLCQIVENAYFKGFFTDSKSAEGNLMPVRVRPSAPQKPNRLVRFFYAKANTFGVLA